MANIPCTNPKLCGVQSHRPGTYAPCHQPATNHKVGSHPAMMNAAPKPATSNEDVSNYVYTPTTRERYGDGNWVPVTDLAIELSRVHGVEITPDGPNSFSFEGEDYGNDVTVTIESKRNKVWITFDGEGEGQESEFYDKFDAGEWMNQIFEQYGKQTADPAEPEEVPEYGKFDPESHLTVGDLPDSLDDEFTFNFDYKDTEGEFYVNVTGIDSEGKAQYDFELDPDGQYDEDYREVVGEFVALSDEDGDYSDPESRESFDAYFQKLIQENYADEVAKAKGDQ